MSPNRDLADPRPCPHVSRRHRRHAQRAVNRGLPLVGHARYVYGGIGRHEDDCSGLTEFCWWAGGVHLPHNAAQQLAWCQPVRRECLAVGDLVFYYDAVQPTHVSMVSSIIPGAQPKITVLQATNEARGIELIGIDDYTPALAYGRPHRKPYVR